MKPRAFTVVAHSLAAMAVVALLAVSGAPAGPNAQTPRRGGTVVVFTGVLVPPGCLNPFGTCNVAVPNAWLSKVLPGALQVGPDLAYRPNLVTRVEVASTDPFTLVYHVRPRARWSDGVPVTASDFVFTHRIFVRNRVTADVASDTRAPWRTIRRVVPLDAKTVRVVFRSRIADWRELFGMVLPRHALSGVDVTKVWSEGIDDPRTGRPIASGPFLLRSYERNDEVVLARNPRYWGPHTAYLDRLVFRVFSSPVAVLDAYRQGEALIGWAFDLPRQAVAAFRDLGGKTVTTPGSQWEHLALRLGPGGNPALRRKLVRRALAYALDRGRITRGVWSDLAPTQRPLQSAVFLAQSRFYRPNWAGYRQRPELVQRLLEQSGCSRDSDGIWVCAGERLSLRLVTNSGNAFRQRALELVQAQLHRSGIEAVPTYVAPSAYLSQVVPSGDFDVAMFSYQVGPSGKTDVFRCGQPENYYGYCSRLTSRDLVQTDLIVDEVQRARVLNAADRKLARDVPLIPLYQLPIFLSYRPTIQNVVPHPQFSSQTWNAENWWLAR